MAAPRAGAPEWQEAWRGRCAGAPEWQEAWRGRCAGARPSEV